MTTNYGRRVIKNTKKPNYGLRILTVGFLAGASIAITVSACTLKVDKPVQGVFDSAVIEQGVEHDWEVSRMNFEPIPCAMDEDLQKFVYDLSYGYGIDFSLAMAVIQKESNYNPDVISQTNDYGLMQINKINHGWLTETLGITDFLDPEENIKAGMYVLKCLFDKYEDTSHVLMAYNMGETSANRLWNEGITSTAYTNAVFSIQKGIIENV